MDLRRIKLEILTDSGFASFIDDCRKEGLDKNYPSEEVFLKSAYKSFSLWEMGDRRESND